MTHYQSMTRTYFYVSSITTKMKILKLNLSIRQKQHLHDCENSFMCVSQHNTFTVAKYYCLQTKRRKSIPRINCKSFLKHVKFKFICFFYCSHRGLCAPLKNYDRIKESKVATYKAHLETSTFRNQSIDHM